MKLTPVRIALIYFLISLTWIIISDHLIKDLFSNLNDTVYFGTLKGIFLSPLAL